MQEQEYNIPVIPNGIEMIQAYYLYLIDTRSPQSEYLTRWLTCVINQVNLQSRAEWHMYAKLLITMRSTAPSV